MNIIYRTLNIIAALTAFGFFCGGISILFEGYQPWWKGALLVISAPYGYALTRSGLRYILFGEIPK